MIIYKKEVYDGTKIGQGGWYNRHGIQIVAYDSETGKRRYVFRNSPCLKIHETVARMGKIPKYMEKQWEEWDIAAQKLCDTLNRKENENQW